jgi:heptosyltransferase-1
LAGSTSTPTYSIFGASSAQKYKPIGTCHKAFQGECPYGKTFEKRCDILRTCKTGACIKQLQGEQLFNHFFDWWSAAASKSQ